MFGSVLIVCVGNICRSPMGEGLARQMFPGARVASAGLSALVGRPADPIAVEIVRERGIDISAHRAQPLTETLVRDFELVLTMESWQTDDVERLAPASRGRVFRLGHWTDFEIRDPYAQPRDAFERAFEGIERGLIDMKAALKIP